MTDPVDRRNLLPPGNTFPREQAIHDADAAVEDLDVLRIVRARDPEQAPLGGALEALAWERSVDVWDPVWTEGTKRAVVIAAPEIHRHKGTRYAVTAALAALGVDNTITEWWETTPKGVPYTFDIVAFAHAPGGGFAVLDARTIRNVYASVMAAKPLSRAFGLHVHGTVVVGPPTVPGGGGPGTTGDGPGTPGAGTDGSLGLLPVLKPRCRVSLAAVPMLPPGVTY